jgi:RNA polymerase sigma factor (sigma-70 family)
MKINKSDLSQIFVSGYNKQKYTEDEILDGILNNSDKMIRYIYKNYFPGIKSMVYGFHSLALDADDVFQDGLVAASRNVAEKRFNGDSNFKTYLTSICRNICLKQMERAKKMQVAASIHSESYDQEPDPDELIYRLTTLKDKMEEKCRQIIDLRFGLTNGVLETAAMLGTSSNMRFEEIATHLNIEPDNARQRFKRCLEKLRETVFNDSAWNEILTSNK